MQWVGNIALWVVWLVLHRGAIDWLGGALHYRDADLNRLLAVVLVGVILVRADLRAGIARMRRPPELHVVPLALLLGGSLLAVWARSAVGLRPLEGALMLLSGYGLLGLFLQPSRWLRGGPVLLLAGCLMPLATYLDVYLGFPARELTARIVAELLGGTLGTATVLELESGVAYVDLPCSGVRSLWTGSVLLLAVAWSLRRGLDRWLVLSQGVLFVGLFAANTLRVLCVVALHHELGSPLAAEIVHLPLGILGFGLAAVGATLVLRVAPPPEERGLRLVRAPRALTAVVLVLLAPISTRASSPPAREVSAPMSLPAEVEALPLTEAERAFATGQGSGVSKGRFDGGELVLVTSERWQAQHLPRHCLEASGFRIREERPVQLGDTTVRWAQADDGVALWWFQSADTVTDDHTARIWASVGGDQEWTMVSVLLHHTPDDLDALTAQVLSLRHHVALQLQEPS